MAISILNYYEQPDGKNLMIMADDLYERNPGEAPDDNMPMDPTNYAISQNLGVPADGSITIVRDFDEDKRVKTVTNVFKEGEWKDSTEGGGSGEQSGAIKIIERSAKEISDKDLRGITKIGSYAFYNYTSLTNITIPDSVKSIGEQAFDGCSSLTSITIPDSVTSIGNSTFSGCSSLTSVTLPKDKKLINFHMFDGCKSLKSFIISDRVTTIDAYAFYNCTSLESITIPNSVTRISDNVFNGCSSLTNVVIPDGVDRILKATFSGCSSLENIQIPNNVTIIDDEAFYKCSSLTSITIPDSVTSIGSYAFSGCSNLSSIKLNPTTPPLLGSNAFYNTAADLQIIVPKGSLETYKKANGWKLYAAQIVKADE